MEVLDKNGLVRFYQNCVVKFFSRKSEPVTDLDSLSEEGLYTCNASTTTLPDGVTSGRVLVTNSGEGASVTQLLLGSNNKVYVRTAPNPQDQPLSWGTWNSLLTSEDIPGDSTGQIQSLEEQLEALQQTVESNKTEVDGKISSLETNLTSNYYDKNNIDTTTGGLSSRIDTVETNLTNNYYDITTLDVNYYDKAYIDINYYDKAYIDTISSRIDGVESKEADLSNKIDSVEKRVDTLEADKVNYVKVSDVANQADKIPRFNSEGHLVLPSGLEIW